MTASPSTVDPAAVPPRDAATVVLLRTDGGTPRVLMGQRGRAAAFMPAKFVFPGGAVDPADRALAARVRLPAPLDAALTARAAPGLAAALALAAIRELWEETGLALARQAAAAAPSADPDADPDPDTGALPGAWARFAAAGHAPAPEHMRLIFRAVTPPGQPRRFDARFFLVPAERLSGDPDRLAGDGELQALAWLTLAEARSLDLPFITEIVLAEVEARLALPPGRAAEKPAPFFHHSGDRSFIDAL